MTPRSRSEIHRLAVAVVVTAVFLANLKRLAAGGIPDPPLVAALTVAGLLAMQFPLQVSLNEKVSELAALTESPWSKPSLRPTGGSPDHGACPIVESNCRSTSACGTWAIAKFRREARTGLRDRASRPLKRDCATKSLARFSRRASYA